MKKIIGNTPAKAESSTTAEAARVEEKAGYTYKITKGEDTRDGSDLWIVRIAENLDEAAYIAENNAMIFQNHHAILCPICRLCFPYLSCFVIHFLLPFNV